MTNAISILNAAAQASPDISWNLIISVFAVCLTAMTAAIAIFKSKKSINDDELRESNLIKDLSICTKENTQKSDTIKETIATLRIEIEKIKVEMVNNSKSVEELRKDNRELVQRLDELLRQLMDLLSN